jgi:crotonobetaine/carnitine-CoA ligase
MQADTVFDAFEASVARWPGQPMMIVPRSATRAYLPEGATLTYREVAGRVQALRELYAAAGYGPGHRVAMLLENRPDHFLHFLALNALGASIVPINPDYRPDEVLYLLEHSEAQLVVSIASRVGDLRAVAATAMHAPPVVPVEPLPTALPPPRSPATAGAPGRDTEAALLYTSGTTARPKGCVLSNDYHFAVGETYLNYGEMASIREAQERTYNPLPLFHMNAGIFSFMGMMLSGNAVVMPDRFHPTTFWAELAETGATIFHYLGVIPPILLKAAPHPDERRHRIRFAVGAGVEPQLHRAFEERFGFPLLELWGMTETGGGFIAASEPRQVDTRAFGRPDRDMLARVVDDQDREVPPGTEGELTVRRKGPNPRRGFFSGYLKNPQATDEAWRGGWFHTGDVVRQDESGMLCFVDRKKNIIRRSGENIAAAEVEAVIQAHERVAQVAVIAVPDALRDEEVMACVVPMAGVAPGADLAREVFDWCMARLAYYKAPGWVVFLDALPTTGTQKVQKGKLFPEGEDPTQRPDACDLRALKKRDAAARR